MVTQQVKDLLTFVLAGGVLMTLVFFLLNFLLGGYLIPFLRVKASRGRKLLVKVRTPVSDHGRIGWIEEGFLVYKDRKGETRRINLEPGCIYRAWTINWIDTDDKTNALFKRQPTINGNAVTGFDAVKYDDLYKRAMYKPTTLQENKWLIIILVFLCFGMLFMGFMLYKMNGNLAGLREMMEGAKTVSKSAAGVVV